MLYDYGPEKNQRLYGSPTPYRIEFGKIKANIAIIGGKYDLATIPEDTEMLKDYINPDALKFIKTDYPVDHAGLITTCNMQFYDDIVKLLETYITKV